MMNKRRKAAPEGKRLRLTSVDAVVRRTRLAHLPDDIAGRVEELADCSVNWTLETASRAGFVHLLDLLAAQEWPGVRATFRRLRCRYAVGEAASDGKLDVLEWWLSSYYGGRELRGACDTVFELAIARGHYHLLDWMNTHDKIPMGNARSRGVPCDDPAIIQWLHELGHKVPLIVKLWSAETEEDLVYMKWLLKHKRSFKRIDGWSWVAFNAAYEGNFRIVKWLYTNRPNDFTINVLKGAISGGNLKIAQWANARKLCSDNSGVSFDRRPFKSLTQPMMEWLVTASRWPSEEERGHWINVTIVNAIKLRDLEAVKFLYGFQDFEPGNRELMATAADIGHLDILQWLHGQGAVSDRWSVCSAAQAGQIQVVQWFGENRPENISEYAMYDAVSGGQLEVFKWLYEQAAITPSAEVVSLALQSNHPGLVKYMLEHEGLCRRVEVRTELQDGFSLNRDHAAIHSNGLDVNFTLKMPFRRQDGEDLIVWSRCYSKTRLLFRHRNSLEYRKSTTSHIDVTVDHGAFA